MVFSMAAVAFFAALMATAGAWVFGMAFPDGYATATYEEKAAALATVTYGYTAVTALAGVFVWFAMEHHAPTTQPKTTSQALGNVLTVAKIPAVWLQAVIIVCAYVGYKGFDNYALFAVQVYGVDPVAAAEITALGSWVRPIAAIAFGLLGDRLGISRLSIFCFILLLISHLFFANDSGRVVLCPGRQCPAVLCCNVRCTQSLFCTLRRVQRSHRRHRHRGRYRLSDRLYTGHFRYAGLQDYSSIIFPVSPDISTSSILCPYSPSLASLRVLFCIAITNSAARRMYRALANT